MVGIIGIGAYVPLFRLDRKVIGARGEKAVCSFDEDSLTMAVEAVNDCLKGQDRETVDALFFGTTTSVYKEHLGATTIAMATDLREDVYAAEFGNSLRAGTAAMMAGMDAVGAGSAKRALVAASDCRQGPPGSALEKTFGDGAAALLIGEGDVAASLEGRYGVYNEIIDLWRGNEEPFVRSWENRFAVEQGYMPSMEKAVRGLMDSLGYKPSDFSRAIIYSPDGKRGAQLGRKLGFDARTQVQDPLIDTMGDTGAASALMLLVGALEEAAPGDLLLLASYGNGADAFALRVHEPIEKIRGRGLGLKGHLESKRMMTDYLKYLRWRGIIPGEKTAGPHAAYSAVAAKREYDRTISIHGSRCRSCGYVQYPPQRICTSCREKDQMDRYSFLGLRGRIFTYNLDYITPRVEIPVATTEVDFHGGGRIQCYMTEVDVETIGVDMPVEMTFRRYTPWQEIPQREGVYNYFWESKPLRG